MVRGPRRELLECLTGLVASVAVDHPVRVAVDGPPASGKTTLADELAIALRSHGRSIIRASIDDFLFPTAQRYRRGEYSPEGCYYDTHDWDALAADLLDPLGPGGDRRYRCSVYDRTSDTTFAPPFTTAPDGAVALVDGVFLQRLEVATRWELRILVSTTPEVTIERAQHRERNAATSSQIEYRWRTRYLPAQQLYVMAAMPSKQADVIVFNDDPATPGWQVSYSPAG